MGDIKLSIYAISDLHLALGTNKPMDIFGESWNNHLTKIELDWKSKAKVDDVILLPGDLSWAMNIKETYLDFKYLNNLPGKKILLKGNHDYWWTTVTSMKRYMLENKFENINFLYNNSYQYEDYIICGTRGWNNTESTEDEKIYKREQQRLKLSIEDGIRKYGRERKIIVCMHYPPFNKIQCEEGFIKIMKQYNVAQCVYGHLHGSSQNEAKEGNIDGIDFKLVSCDYTDFKLIKLQ